MCGFLTRLFNMTLIMPAATTFTSLPAYPSAYIILYNLGITAILLSISEGKAAISTG